MSDADVATTTVVSGETIIKAARVCLGVRMANLTSATLAQSQERFVQSPACEDDVRYLLTFIRADYDGTMIGALRDKGWICTGWTKPSQAGNREEKTIRERYKWRFLCPIDPPESQATFAVVTMSWFADRGGFGGEYRCENTSIPLLSAPRTRSPQLVFPIAGVVEAVNPQSSGISARISFN